MVKQIKSENPPLYFVPTAILCSCGQRVMVSPEGFSLNLKVICTNFLCPENSKEKKVDLSKFAFTDYEVLDS